MRVRFVVLLLPLAGLIAPASAAADCVHVVLPGESLTSIAAADGLSVGALATANGLSSGAGLLTGSCLTIPPQGGPVSMSGTMVAQPGSAPGPSTGSYVVQPGDTLSGIAARAGMSLSGLAAANGLDPVAPLLSGTVLQLSGGGQTSSAPQPSSGGSYVVQPGDTLTAIAARAGTSMSQLATANGLDPMAPLLSGTVLQLSGGAQTSGTAVAGDGDSDSDDGGGATTTSSTTSSGGSYVVQPGDTLTAIAARDGTTVSQLASANGLDPMAPLLSGTVLQLSGGAQTSSGSLPQSASPGGSYTVQPGDTLSGIAARAGMSLSDLASLNGLNPLEPLLSGTVLRLAGSGPTGTGSIATSQPVGAAAEGNAVSPPYPTPQTVSPSEVGSIAAANGVPPALAEAIAYQESGFNNAAVSTSDARGVMQILPGTWDYIQNSLTPGTSPLAPASASDNVRGGVLLLRSLLNATGGNDAMAAAGYYQGLPSVEVNGMYGDTQQYVNNVLALEQRFNGGG
jgi:LysM repeat protein